MTHTHPAGLELSFRRLLARYPAEYRVQREDEMLATLMESSRPEQGRPAAKDVLDLTVGAVRAHLRRGPLSLLRDGVSAAALPAALLLVGLLGMAVVPIVGAAFITAWGLDLGTIDPDRNVLAETLARSGPRLLAALALGVALLTHKPVAVRAVAGVLAAVLLAVAAGSLPPYVPGSEEDLVPGLLAALVIAAPSARDTAARRLGRPLVFAVVLLPISGSAIAFGDYLHLAYQGGTVAVAGPDILSILVSGGVFVLGVLLGAGLVARRAGAGGLGGAVLLLIAAAPSTASVYSAAVGYSSSTPSTFLAIVSTVVVLSSAAAAVIAVCKAGTTPAAA